MASLNDGVLPLEVEALNRQNDELNDGQPAKRRGPKPDSKPALTRRQELNRQAQRTHRERKEQYMRALETEVSRLREAYTQEISAANLTVHQHREMVRSLSEENNILKEILAAHGINYEAEVERRKAERTSPTNATYQSSPFASSVGSQPAAVAQLESPCREHTDYLCRRSITEADDEDMPFSGHALMASCPPPSYIANTTHEQAYPHQTYNLPHANLTTLLNLSRQLVTDGQITPIMALQCLKNHEMYRSLTRDDIRIIIDTLNTKVRCYGFGAVVEDFELMDCLSSVIGTRVELGFSRAGDETLYS
ncbi:hypothetical protein APSETT444_000624 [Aspergillus pseudonomiae]